MYKVTCLYGGTTYTLHDPLSEDLRIYDDQVETETNAPGSMRFSVPYNHPYLDKIVGLSSDIRVYDGSEEIFRCRPITDGEDLYRSRTFKCEGELAFLYDSIQPRRELHGVTPYQLFSMLVEEHNRQVQGGPIDKTFRVGVVTVNDPNNSLYRYTNRETTFDCITGKLIKQLGGHLRVRTQNGYRYLDLLAEVDTISDQPIQLGDNLLDYSRDTDYTQIATACIPLGAAQEETEIAALDAYLTIESVNSGSSMIQLNNAVQKFGFICKVVSFDDITVPANLKTAGTAWLQDGQYEDMTLTLTAVDLHGLGYDLQPMRIDTQVRVVSQPHGMDRYFPVSKRTYHLTEPEQDTVTVGSTERQKSYTSSNKGQVSAVQDHAEQMRQNFDSIIDKERQNVSNMLNLATHGYVVLDPNDGPTRILIMDTNNIDTAQKIWKWDMNGLAYSGTGKNGPWSSAAITADGKISADHILTGTLDAERIKAGILSDLAGKTTLDMSTGALHAEKFSVDATNFQLTEQGNLTANNASLTNVSATGTITSEISYNYGGTTETQSTSVSQGQVSFYKNGALSGFIDATSTADPMTGGASRDVLAIRADSASAITFGIPWTGEGDYAYEYELVINNGLNPWGYTEPIYAGADVRLNSSVFVTGTINHGTKENPDDHTGSVEVRYTEMTGSRSPYVGVYGGLYVDGDLSVHGTNKARVVDTDNYGTVALCAMESTRPVFSDLGSGLVGEDGFTCVFLDPDFVETVVLSCGYHVFLTQTSLGTIEFTEKMPDHFIVHGIPGTTFDWIVYAAQNGSEGIRLDQSCPPERDLNMEAGTFPMLPPDSMEQLASDYLNSYEEEIYGKRS